MILSPSPLFSHTDGNRYVIVIEPADPSDNRLDGLVYYWARKMPGSPLPTSLAVMPELPGELGAKAQVEKTKYQIELFDEPTRELYAIQDILAAGTGRVHTLVAVLAVGEAMIAMDVAVASMNSTMSGVG